MADRAFIEHEADIVILGLGPAALALALALRSYGLRPVVVGRPRKQSAVEGLSHRAVGGLWQLGFTLAVAQLQMPGRRVASWGGAEAESNGEFIVERQAFDAALAADARCVDVELCTGAVQRLERKAPHDWCVLWQGSDGFPRILRARFVVEGRGHSAPKWGVDRYTGPTSLAVARQFRSEWCGRAGTFTEALPDGWAWGALHGNGRATVQITMQPNQFRQLGGSLNGAHAAAMSELTVLGRICGRVEAVGDAVARGTHTTWRGASGLADGLRIGDAAYTTDPLSGHGMFEAVSGALAAAPVIHTLLRRPEATALALGYYEARIERTFIGRLSTAKAHYLAESRWADRPFWRSRQALRDASWLATAPVRGVAIERQPVVENGFIVERRVVRTPAHPRGVRFIDGIDLALLHDALRASPRCSMESLCVRLGAKMESVQRAAQWLCANGMEGE